MKFINSIHLSTKIDTGTSVAVKTTVKQYLSSINCNIPVEVSLHNEGMYENTFPYNNFVESPNNSININLGTELGYWPTLEVSANPETLQVLYDELISNNLILEEQILPSYSYYWCFLLKYNNDLLNDILDNYDIISREISSD